MLSHPDVLEAGAFAVPHERLGENVAAVVVLRPNSRASPQQLRQFAAKRLARYKVPGLIRAVPEIPKGASGKVRRKRAGRHALDAYRHPETTARILAAIGTGVAAGEHLGGAAGARSDRDRPGCLRARRRFPDGDAIVFASARALRRRVVVRGHLRCPDGGGTRGPPRRIEQKT